MYLVHTKIREAIIRSRTGGGGVSPVDVVGRAPDGLRAEIEKERIGTMRNDSNFWVVGGEFRSLNFHTLVEGSAQVRGPFRTRGEAESAWKAISEENRHRAGVRFSIVEEPVRAVA